MSSLSTNPNSGEARSISELPNDLVIEILTRIPGKQVGRCKCVCKPWRKMIGSRPFMEIYRKRQRGMLLYWADEINRDDGPDRRIRFFHCPLRRLEEPREEFNALRELEFRLVPSSSDHGTRYLRGATQVVNGLICVREGEFSDFYAENNLTIHNICTGEVMRVPDPLPCKHTSSTFHLGYDPASKVYKLLRLIFSKVDAFSMQGAHIMTLTPPSISLSTWRELDFGALDLRLIGTHSLLKEDITSPDDGILWWTIIPASSKTPKDEADLLCFDLNTERFQLVDYPEQDMEMKWSEARKLHMDISKEYEKSGGFESGSSERLVTVSLSFSSSDLLVRNPDHSWLVYPLSCRQTQHKDKDDVFIVGELPDGAPDLQVFSESHTWHCRFIDPLRCSVIFRCFTEGNNVYLSLDDILGGGVTEF